VRLRILLAHTFLNSYSFEKGIALLEVRSNINFLDSCRLFLTFPQEITAWKLPVKQQKQVTEMLILAYRKKGWFKEGQRLLEIYKTIIDQEEKEADIQNVSDVIKFWKLAALHFFKCEQYKAAICCVDKSIMLTVRFRPLPSA